MLEISNGTSVKVAVRIRPLSGDEALDDNSTCVNVIPGAPQVGSVTFSIV